MSKVTITIEADNVTMGQYSKLSEEDKRAVAENASSKEVFVSAYTDAFVKGMSK